MPQTWEQKKAAKAARKKKIMDYEDSPSGFVTLYNYKEPFMEYTGGYGYRGVLMFDGKTQKVQCHECGLWMQYLPNHLHKEHNMRAREYKNRVGLRQSTALISEELRKKLIANGMETRSKNLVPNKNHTKETKAQIAETLRKNKEAMEYKNEKGTCPAQLIDRLIKLADKLGRTPSEKECTFNAAIRMTYGSMKEACRVAGLKYRKPGENINHHKKLTKFRFTDDQLLNFIRVFTDKHEREPSTSDLKRKLLPSYRTYTARFGGWKKAKELALT